MHACMNESQTCYATMLVLPIIEKRGYRIQLSPLITPLDGTSEKSILSMISSGNAMRSF